MSATTTAICVIVMGTAGGTIRAPLPLAIRYLLGCSQLGAEQVQVPGRVDPAEDGAAAHDDVDTPARDLGPGPALDQPHPGSLFQPAHPGEQFWPGPPPPPEGHHRQGLLVSVSSPAERAFAHHLHICSLGPVSAPQPADARVSSLVT